MNNLNVKNYKDYVEVVNGLFTVDKVMFEMGLDDPEEFTFRQRGIQIVPRGITGIINQLEQYQPAEYNRTLTRQDIEETISDIMFRPRVQDYRVYIDPVTSQELLRFEEELDIQRERNRIVNERLSLDLSNMSEQQLLEHFDRISQEE